MDYDSIADIASGKWLLDTWGEEYTRTKLEKAIVRVSRQLVTLLKKWDVEQYKKEREDG